MGGRGGGSPATRQGQGSSTIGARQAAQINLTVVDKPAGQPWRVVGDGPESVLGQAGLLVNKSGAAFEIRNSVTDQVLGRGSTLANAAKDLSARTGVRVVVFDEVKNKQLGEFG